MALTPRMLLGKDGAGDMAWRASRAGVDVLTNTDPEEFTFNSDWPRTGLIHEVGEIAAGGVWVMFAALPFVPFVDTFAVKDGKLFADRQTVVAWDVSTSGPVTTWWPTSIQDDRFFFAITADDASWPDSLAYIVWRVPIEGA